MTFSAGHEREQHIHGQKEQWVLTRKPKFSTICYAVFNELAAPSLESEGLRKSSLQMSKTLKENADSLLIHLFFIS